MVELNTLRNRLFLILAVGWLAALVGGQWVAVNLLPGWPKVTGVLTVVTMVAILVLWIRATKVRREKISQMKQFLSALEDERFAVDIPVASRPNQHFLALLAAKPETGYEGEWQALRSAVGVYRSGDYGLQGKINAMSAAVRALVALQDLKGTNL